MKTTSPDCRPPPPAYIRESSREIDTGVNASHNWKSSFVRRRANALLQPARSSGIASLTRLNRSPKLKLAMTTPRSTPRKRERKPLPAHLPRQRIEYELPEGQKVCPCCAHTLHLKSEELSEQLHIEAKASVLQHVRFNTLAAAANAVLNVRR